MNLFHRITNLSAQRNSQPPLFINRDVAEISIQPERPDPAEPGFFSKVEYPRREEIALSCLAAVLRKMVSKGSVSQADADRQLDNYRDKMRHAPFANDFQPMNSSAASCWQDTHVSMVPNATITTTRNVTIKSVLEDIRSEKWAKQIENIRYVYREACAMEGPREAKEAVRALKEKLPGFLASGTFTKRANAKVDKPSGLICVDLDDCQNIDVVCASLVSDPFVAAFFTSPTGSGLKVILRIRADANLHLRSFFAAREHFRQCYGLEIDESGKDVARLCFVSHDAQLFMRNGDAEILEPLPEPEPEEPAGGSD
jgi:hypothetical protein